MLAREEKYIHDWETKRSKGKWTYIFLTALVWGTMLPVVIEAFKLAVKGLFSLNILLYRIFDDGFLPVWIKFVAGFFIFALLMWHLSKRKYLQLKRKQMEQRQIRIPN